MALPLWSRLHILDFRFWIAALLARRVLIDATTKSYYPQRQILCALLEFPFIHFCQRPNPKSKIQNRKWSKLKQAQIDYVFRVRLDRIQHTVCRRRVEVDAGDRSDRSIEHDVLSLFN